MGIWSISPIVLPDVNWQVIKVSVTINTFRNLWGRERERWERVLVIQLCLSSVVTYFTTAHDVITMRPLVLLLESHPRTRMDEAVTRGASATSYSPHTTCPTDYACNPSVSWTAFRPDLNPVKSCFTLRNTVYIYIYIYIYIQSDVR